MPDRTDFTTTPTPADHYTTNEHGVTLADLKTTIATINALADHYFADGERLPKTPGALAGTLQAYEVSSHWIRTGISDEQRSVRLSLSELCACTPARKYEQTGWTLTNRDWLDDGGAVVEFSAPDDMELP